MKIRLSQKDIEVLMFLGKYKMMLGIDCKRIYKVKDYHRKRLKVLEQENYIRRVNRFYIKLDTKGTKLVKQFGYDYNNICRNKEYKDRLNEIAKVAALTLNSNIEFVASWNLKDNNIFTETSRKYLGEMTFKGKNAIVYYISKDKQTIYIRQIINDIQKTISYKNIIIFMEDFKIFNKSNQNFIFGKESTVIIKPTTKGFETMRIIQETDFYEILKQIYPDKEILLSNWRKADYMTNDKEYIVLMPFIDTEKLHRLNIFYKNNQKTNRKIDIITFKENKKKIDEILTNKTNVIELDNLLGGMDGEVKKV